MENYFEEYITFHVTTKDGTTVEMAVVDEFEFEHKHYVVGALIKDDMIVEEGRYIYRCIMKEEDFEVQKILNEIEYTKVANAYMEME